MKKTSYSRIIVLVLSLALLIGAALCIVAAATDDTSTGAFGSISIAYGDKVALQVEVDATEEEIKNGDVIVSYTLCGKTANAEYFTTDEDGSVWVITEGIAAYNLAEVVTFSSYVGDTQVESDRTCSVAQFLYMMLYMENSTATEKDINLYNALLAYGEAAQLALGINTDSVVTDSTFVHTANADVTLGGKSFAFTTEASLSVTPTYSATIPAGKELVGWNILDNGTEKQVGLTFDCTGVVEIVSPAFSDEEGSNSIRILTIGNSFSSDATEHLYNLCKAAGYDTVVIGNLYIGGCSLKTHLSNMQSDTADYTFYLANEDTGKMTAYKEGATALEGIEYTGWDFITLQQASGSSGLSDTYSYLGDVIAYVNEHKTNANAKALLAYDMGISVGLRPFGLRILQQRPDDYV